MINVVVSYIHKLQVLVQLYIANAEIELHDDGNHDLNHGHMLLLFSKTCFATSLWPLNCDHCWVCRVCTDNYVCLF